MEWYYIAGLSVAAFVVLLALYSLITILLKRADNDRLATAKERANVQYFHSSNGYSLAYRLTFPSPSSTFPARPHPIVIPNGLAATLVMTNKIQEELSDAGFVVLSFDRPGVGFSKLGNSSPRRLPTVDACIQDVLEAMINAENEIGRRSKESDKIPSDYHRWIVLGPSMGSVVGQCFMTSHPNKTAGFLNMDGFPAPFSCKREKFMSSSTMYSIASVFARLGLIRPSIFLAGRFVFPAFATSLFPVEVITAQMNNAEFYSNTKIEFSLMLDLADRATEQWGSLDLLKMDHKTVDKLENVAPANNGDIDEFTGQWVAMPRAVVEKGSDWESSSTTSQLREWVSSVLPSSPLGTVLSSIPVRVMSARSYDYFGGDSFYDEHMKKLAAAEHNLHTLLSDRALRYAFPKLGHNNIFQNTKAIVQCCIEIANDCSDVNT